MRNARIAALLSATLLAGGTILAAPAHADVREVGGYESCAAGQYIGLRITLERPQTIRIYFDNRLQRTEYTTLVVYDYPSRTPQASWRVTGADIETVSDYCYTPSGGPVL